MTNLVRLQLLLMVLVQKHKCDLPPAPLFPVMPPAPLFPVMPPAPPFPVMEAPNFNSPQCGVQATGNEPRRYRPLNSKKAGKNRIVSGQAAKPHSWPWQVALYKDGGSKFFGGAVLLQETDIILTAAHIIDDAGGSDMTAVAGAHILAQKEYDPDVDIAPVINYVTHKGYKSDTTDNDIALLLLDKKIRFGSKKIPACLPAAEQEPDEGARCAVTGFGLLKDKLPSQPIELPEMLQEAYINVIAKQRCNETLVYNGSITQQMFCAGFLNGMIDACQGDSGGPLVCKTGHRWTLFGLISWGEGCANANHPGVFTKVSRFLDWIQTNIPVLRSAGKGPGFSA